MVNQVFILMLLLLGAFFVVDDKPEEKLDKQRIVSAAAEIQKRADDDVYYAKIDLDHFSVGSTATLNVKLTNPFDKEIKFTGVSNKCICKQFKMRGSSVPANGETVVSFDIDVPPRQRSAVVSTDVSLVNNGTSVIRIDLSYRLDGLMAFQDLISIVKFDKVSETQKELKIPFVITEPVQISDVEAVVSSNLQGVGIEIVSADKENHFVKLSIPDSVLQNGKVRGELNLRHRKTNQTDTYLLTIKDTRTNEISPEILKFQKTGDQWKATAIVKVAGKIATESEVGTPIECIWREQKLDLKLKKLANNTYRVSVIGNDSMFEDQNSDAEKMKLRWKIYNGSDYSELQTQFIVDR